MASFPNNNIWLFTRNPGLEGSWPFVHEQMVKRLEKLGVTLVLNTTSRDLFTNR